MSENPATVTTTSPIGLPLPRNTGLAAFVVTAGVFLSFWAYSTIQAPIPGPNEPHYLCKAKHYWNPEYCPNDVFLESSNAHQVFYQTVGILTLFLSLEQTAWVGRILVYGLLAIGWTCCLRRMTGDVRHALWAAWVFLAIANFGNLSGEWMVGGLESKVFAYAFLLWAIAQLLGRRWLSAAALAGASVSFHPVVGVWGVIAGGIAAATYRFLRSDVDDSDVDDSQKLAETTSSFKNRWLWAIGLGLLCAMPGLVPAVSLVLVEGHPEAAEANRIQVFERLAHHLDPTEFCKLDTGDYEIEVAWLQYAVMTLFWLSLRLRLRRSPAESWFCRFVLAAGLIALAGAFVGWMPRTGDGFPQPDTTLLDLRVTLMKFYPFRLFDVCLPIAVAMTLTQAINRTQNAPTLLRRLAGAGIFGGFLVLALVRPIPDRNPSHMRPAQRADWLAVCDWIRENTPEDAQVRTPAESWAFKWHAQRAEYESYKDCPQDAAGILEWRRRQLDIRDWDRNYATFSTEALRELLEQEGITHFICRAGVQDFDIAPAFQNDHYRVYRLKDAESGR